MVINQPKNATHNSKIYKSKIETVESYLGIIISNKGNFKVAIEEFVSKATRTYIAFINDYKRFWKWNQT